MACGEPRVGHKRALLFVVGFVVLRAVSFVVLVDSLRSGAPVASGVFFVLLYAACMLVALQRPWETLWPPRGLVVVDAGLQLVACFLALEGLRIGGAMRLVQPDDGPNPTCRGEGGRPWPLLRTKTPLFCPFCPFLALFAPFLLIIWLIVALPCVCVWCVVCSQGSAPR